MANTDHPKLSKRRRSSLLGVNLSNLYVKRKPLSAYDVTLMNEIQDIYAVHPFKGYRRIFNDLRDEGHLINKKRVLRLMRLMGLQAIYPKKNLSIYERNENCSIKICRKKQVKALKQKQQN